jgi:hypothetical protein
MKFTREERDMIYYSLSMRAGYIETGDPVLRAHDAYNMKKNDMIKPLSTDQMKGILMIEDLMSRILNERD